MTVRGDALAAAAALGLAGDASRALACIAGDDARAAEAVFGSWQPVSRDARAAAIAKAAQTIRAQLPRNAEHAHPGWKVTPTSPTLRVWSQRASWGQVVELPTVRNRIPRTADALAELDVATLLAAMTALGAVSLIHLALDVGAVAVASLANRVAPRCAGLVAALHATVADPRVRSSLGSARGVADVVRGSDLAQSDAMAIIGVRVVAPHLTRDVAATLRMRLDPGYASELREFSSSPSLPWIGVVTALAASSPWWLARSPTKK